jgi:outer membrane protein
MIFFYKPRYFIINEGGQKMKKKFVALFFVFAALMLVVIQISFAQDMEGRLGIGARVAYVNFSDEELYKFDVDPDESPMYGGNITYFVLSYLSIELSVDYLETDVDLDSKHGSIDIGDLKKIPVLLSLRTHLPTNAKVSPYLTVGIGYYFNDFDMKSYAPAGYDIDIDDSFGYHLGGGIEYFFNNHFAFNLDFKYISDSVDVDFEEPGGYWVNDKNLDMDFLSAEIGFKYYF